MNLRDKLTGMFMEEAKKYFREQNEEPIPPGEEDDEKLQGAEVAPTKKPKKEDKEAAGEKKDKNEFQKVDDITKEIDFSSLKNKGRLELLEIIIDSAQNSEEEGDKFDKFMGKVSSMVDDYLDAIEGEEEGKEEEEGEGEEEEESGEAAPEEGAEEEGEEEEK